MVIRHSSRWRAQRGLGRLGCLVWLLVIVSVLYYGLPIGRVVFKDGILRAEMRTQARLAPSIDDATIRRRLLRKIEELQLPNESRRLTIRRTSRPREILIRTSYEVTFVLPFYSFPLTFRPEARLPL